MSANEKMTDASDSLLGRLDGALYAGECGCLRSDGRVAVYCAARQGWAVYEADDVDFALDVAEGEIFWGVACDPVAWVQGATDPVTP